MIHERMKQTSTQEAIRSLKFKLKYVVKETFYRNVELTASETIRFRSKMLKVS